ncbi:MAG: DUF1993 domain-containing protein [Deltaproteobacteria bacterium]|nr:DUF1993 domain-containing protein [Deltaproteobacteria bacterium]
MIYQTVQQMKKQLLQLNQWFDAAVAHADAKKFDPNLYLGFRLAPDQFGLVKQVQVACDTSKLMAARLTGKEAPKHADDEKTLEELRARVADVATYLGTFTEQDFAGAAERVITQPRWEGKVMSGADYFLEHAVPNFFFHLAHAYAILRHNGVPLGKRDYLGALTQRLP